MPPKERVGTMSNTPLMPTSVAPALPPKGPMTMSMPPPLNPTPTLVAPYISTPPLEPATKQVNNKDVRKLPEKPQPKNLMD